MATKLPKLSKTELATLARKGWAYQRKSLTKNYEFRDFDDAFGFMARAALTIAHMDHHPAWLNIYNRVYVELTTHDAGGVTAKDMALATLMDRIAVRFSGKR